MLQKRRKIQGSMIENPITIPRKNLQVIANNLDKIILDNVRKIEGMVLQLNRDQLWQGKKIDGSSITPPYAPRTVKLKLKVGQPIDRVTLKDDGFFYDGFYIIYETDQFTIYSHEDYTKYLTGRYNQGSDIFGLTEENLNKVREIIIKEIVKQIKQAA